MTPPDLPTTEDLTLCDREPIHIPGSIQPFGLLLVANAESLKVTGGAGDIETRLSPNWLQRPLSELLSYTPPASSQGLDDGHSLRLARVSRPEEVFDVLAHRLGDNLLIELQPAESDPLRSAEELAIVEEAGTALHEAGTLEGLCDIAARAFRRLTGYGRVMIYRFLEDAAGVVVAEDSDPHLGSFLHHHFPATDIPKQARALYVRNPVRVIPDVHYTPAPLRADGEALRELDMSDLVLRSVSPIHIQYLKNMGVGASASMSIIRDGALWGLVACHNESPKDLSLSTRMACHILATTLSQHIRSHDEAELSRQRVRLRVSEDRAFDPYEDGFSLEQFVEASGASLRTMMAADGLAVLTGTRVHTFGHCPSETQVSEVMAWLRPRVLARPFQTNHLSAHLQSAEECRAVASGVLGLSVAAEVETLFMWFRAEQRAVVEWAGNPHKNSSADPQAVLTPRASFETWSESVHGRSCPWSLAEVESASRLARLLVERGQTTRLRSLNRELTASLDQNTRLLQQKEFLMREVNHRVQNSLQLVSSFLTLQSRDAGDPVLSAQLSEADRRLRAVALVHRRLYSGDDLEVVDLGRYLEDLIHETQATMSPDWANSIEFSGVPAQMSADNAVAVGLILTELIINAQKYAYDGKAGPLEITLDQHGGELRLTVSDKGRGKSANRQGFGSRMIAAMVAAVKGTLEEADNHPGLKVTLAIRDR